MQKLINWFVILLLGLLGAVHSASANIEYRYFYDELNRLVKAVDSTGVVLEYVYDEVGNILDVIRTENNGVSILDVQPHASQAGALVVIEGIGFSSVANENSVTFDGISANVLSATANKLEVEVPAGVTAGVLVVTVAGNTATANNNFQLQVLPVISSLSIPYVLSGTSIPSLTVTGNNLTDALFTFTPAFVPAAMNITSAIVAPDGKSAILNIDVAATAIGSFVLQASNTVGSSDTFSSIANTLTVLGAADDDSDGDGLTNAEEIAQGTNPTSGDSDNDGLPDKYEIDNGLDPNSAADALLDSDNDGTNNLAEFEQGTDPLNSDITPPGVDQVLPADNETDFPANGKVVVRFTEQLQPTSILTGSVRLFQGELLISAQNTLSDDQLSITIDPAESLSAFTTYTVQVQSVRDAAGNPIAGVFTSNFTTVEFIDDIPPELVSFSIPNDAIDVPVNAPIMVLFNEQMDPATLNDTTFTLRDNTIHQNIAGIIQVNPDGTTVSFVPEQQLSIGRNFTATINTTITDISGNPLSRRLSFRFNTSFDEDILPPNAIGVSPQDGSVDVPTNSNIMVEFDEALDLINVIGSITIQADGVDILGSTAISNASRRVTFTPTVELDPNTIITVSASTKITDLAGNTLNTAISSQFTTGPVIDLQRPSVITMTPFHNETNVPTNTSLHSFEARK